jgi:hypothetical protein
LDKEIRPLKLTAAEKKDLIEFLGALNGDKVDTPEPVLPQ